MRRAKRREAVDVQFALHQENVDSIERVIAATDTRDVDAIVAALSNYGSIPRRQPLEPFLVLRDPQCARSLFTAHLRMPASGRNWLSVSAALLGMLAQREMDPASACAWVAAEVPSMAEDVAIGAATMLLRWGRPDEAVELMRLHCIDGDMWRLRIETLASRDPDEKACCLSRMRTEFARQGGMSTANLLVAEMHGATSDEKRDKLLRHLVVDHGATPFDLPAVSSLPPRGEGPRRLFVVRAFSDERELPAWTSMIVVALDEDEATHWAKVFVPTAVDLTLDELWTVDSPLSGLCLPYGPAGAYHRDVGADWTGLSTWQDLFQAVPPLEHLLPLLLLGELPRLGPPESLAPPPLFAAMMKTGRFELVR